MRAHAVLFDHCLLSYTQCPDVVCRDEGCRCGGDDDDGDVLLVQSMSMEALCTCLCTAVCECDCVMSSPDWPNIPHTTRCLWRLCALVCVLLCV